MKISTTKFILVFLILLQTVCIPFKIHSHPLQIGSYYISGLVVDEQSGLFVKMHNEILTRINMDADLILQPTKRMQRSFVNNMVDSYFPELWEHVPKQDAVVSDAFWLKKIVVFSLKDIKYHSAVDLEELRVGVVNGYSYGEHIINNPRIKFDFANNDDLNVEGLIKGRIDVIIGDNASTLTAVNNSQHKDKICYDLDSPVAILNVFYVCQNTREAKTLCNKISHAIEEMKQEKVIELDYKTGNSKINL